MKNKTTSKNTTESQIWYDINDVNAVKFIVIQKGKANGPIVPNPPGFGRAGGRFCTGPPGRAPDAGARGDPKHPPELIGDKNQINTKVQFFNTYLNFKLLQTFNFFIMKKQILFLAFFVMAVFATTTTAFGQGAVKYSDPIPLTCDAADALHPMAGRSYNYVATGTPAGGDFRFWATKNGDFITTTGTTTTFNHETAANVLTITTDQLLAHSANYNSADVATSVDITWSSALLGGTSYQGVNAPKTPTFVAAYYNNTATGCADNFKVWELDPINGFTVDVLSLDSADLATMPDYAVVPAQCPDIVRNATYVANEIHYDYGTNNLYFEFVAANFSGYWIPTFDLATSLGTSQTIVKTEFTYDLPATWDATTVWNDLVSGTTQINVDPSVTDTELGVSVFVRVKIANNQFENLLGQTLTMVLDGENAEGLWDVNNSDCGLPLDKLADGDDTTTQTITARPAIASTIVTTAPTNTTVIPGDEE